MGEVIKAQFSTEKAGDIEYHTDGGQVVGVSHSDMPLSIARADNMIVFDNGTGDQFTEVSRDQFNELLMAWLLVDAPHLLGEATGK